MRLSHYLAQAGVASRRSAETIILASHVRVNGTVVTTLGSKIDPNNDQVEVKNASVWKTVTLPLATVCYALNKPVGFTSTTKDPHARHTVMELVPQNPPVVPIGRLDRETTGLLLLSNDGALVHMLTHPSHHVAKTYRVVCSYPDRYNKNALPQNITKLASGIMLDGEMTAPAQIHITNSNWKTADRLHLRIVLNQGKNRQIRRSLQKIGLNVLQLERIAIGKLSLDSLNLEVGQSVKLTSQQLEQVKN